ncbi:hypothetical protein ACQPZF_12420 [Actinosynnema sp. CS-041913]|uniref:hypothetical protein n=1 Tax=Actinosynnema sp. CS-041913 TaxID=3239917 RepID=UPI003D9288D6
MIGFEVEISLLVVDGKGKSLPGESNLAQCPNYGMKIVSDRRQKNSNIEFVTEPVSVVGAGSGTGPGTLAAQLAAIKEMRDVLYAAKPGSFAAAIAKHGTAVEDGVTARIIEFPAKYSPAEDDGSDGLFLHYSVGVPVRSLAGFFDLVRKIAPYVPGRQNFLNRARFRMFQAADFAAVVAKDFAANGASGRDSVQAMYAYAQLVYTQIAGIADYTSEVDESGQVKNGTVALGRTSFHEIYPMLPVDVRQYLAKSWDDESMLDRIAKVQDETETQGVTADFNEHVIRSVPGLPEHSLKDYLQSALTGAPQVGQSTMYGKMTLIAPAQENNLDVIVFELRTVGSHYKTWNQVNGDLDTLVRWVQNA